MPGLKRLLGAAIQAGNIEGVGHAAAGPSVDRDRLEQRQFGELGPHLVVEPMIGHSEKILAAMNSRAVFKAPLVGDAGNRLPFDRVERMRVDIVDQRREELAVVRHQLEPGICGERLAHLGAQRAPAAQPVQRVILGGNSDARYGERLAAAENGERGSEV